MAAGYPLCSYAVFDNLGSTETRFDTTIGNVIDFDDLGESVTARLTGSVNDFTGSEVTFRLRAAESGGANFVASPLVATFPTVHGNGPFSVATTFTPPPGPHMYVLTQQTDTGAGTADEVVFILEVEPS